MVKRELFIRGADIENLAKTILEDVNATSESLERLTAIILQVIPEDSYYNLSEHDKFENKVLNGLFDLLARIASKKNTNSDTLDRIINFGIGVKYPGIFENPNIRWETLDEYSKKGNQAIRSYIAVNPSIDARIFTRLSQDESEIVVNMLALNPTSVFRKLWELSSKGGKKKWNLINAAMVRYARNSNTPEGILDKLSSYEFEDVKIALLQNPSTPKDTVNRVYKNLRHLELKIRLANDSRTRGDVLDKFSRCKNTLIKIFTARNPSTWDTSLERLSKDKDENVRANVAENPSTNKETCKILVKDPSWVVRRSVARNLNMDVEDLMILYEDFDSEVSDAVLANPNATFVSDEERSWVQEEDLYAVDYFRVRDNSTTFKELSEIRRDSELDIEMARRQPNKPEILEKLAKTQDVKVLKAVMYNEDTTADTMRSYLNLMDNPCPEVLKAMSYNPHVTRKVAEICFAVIFCH